MRAELGLPSVRGDDDKGGGMMGGFGGSMGGVTGSGKGKRPIQVKFEIPYFTTSGIQVRYLKIIEPKVRIYSFFPPLFMPPFSFSTASRAEAGAGRNPFQQDLRHLATVSGIMCVIPGGPGISSCVVANSNSPVGPAATMWRVVGRTCTMPCATSAVQAYDGLYLVLTSNRFCIFKRGFFFLLFTDLCVSSFNIRHCRG